MFVLSLKSGLIKKMIQYAQPELLTQLCSAQKENLGILLVEVVANVLDVEVRIYQLIINPYKK